MAEPSERPRAKRPPVETPPKPSVLGRVLATVIIVGIVLFFLIRAPSDPPETGPPVAPTSDAGVVVLPPRCAAHGPEGGVLIGNKDGVADDAGFVPFGPEIGRGFAAEDGFRVGVKHQVDGVMVGAVARVDTKGGELQLLELGKSRGDIDPPTVVSKADGWVVAMLEPNASGMSLRLAQFDGDVPTWGAEIAQGRDESLAYDLAFGKTVGVVAWDDVTDDDERGVIMLTTVTAKSLEGGRKARAVSSEDVDAELPRVVRRGDGFWLAYVARAIVDVSADAGSQPEGRYRAERIEPSWIELVPLDERGKLAGAPRAVTRRDGYALAYDIQPAVDGGAFLTWRDNDTPSGAHGGRVTSLLVTASGEGQEQTITEEDVGAGVPSLIGSWVAIPNRRAEIALGPLASDGQVVGDLRAEPMLHDGQLIAATGNVFLVAYPAGPAVRMRTVRCLPKVTAEGGATADGGS